MGDIFGVVRMVALLPNALRVTQLFAVCSPIPVAVLHTELARPFVTGGREVFAKGVFGTTASFVQVTNALPDLVGQARVIDAVAVRNLALIMQVGAGRGDQKDRKQKTRGEHC